MAPHIHTQVYLGVFPPLLVRPLGAPRMHLFRLLGELCRRYGSVLAFLVHGGGHGLGVARD